MFDMIYKTRYTYLGFICDRNAVLLIHRESRSNPARDRVRNGRLYFQGAVSNKKSFDETLQIFRIYVCY